MCAVVWASTSTALGRTPGSCIIRLKTKHLLHCSAHYTQKEQHLTARKLGRQHSRTDPQLPRQLSNRTSAHWKPGIPALFVQQQGMFGPRAPVYFTIFPSVMGSLGPFRCHFSDLGMGGWHEQNVGWKSVLIHPIYQDFTSRFNYFNYIMDCYVQACQDLHKYYQWSSQLRMCYRAAEQLHKLPRRTGPWKVEYQMHGFETHFSGAKTWKRAPTVYRLHLYGLHLWIFHAFIPFILPCLVIYEWLTVRSRHTSHSPTVLLMAQKQITRPRNPGGKGDCSSRGKGPSPPPPQSRTNVFI